MFMTCSFKFSHVNHNRSQFCQLTTASCYRDQHKIGGHCNENHFYNPPPLRKKSSISVSSHWDWLNSEFTHPTWINVFLHLPQEHHLHYNILRPFWLSEELVLVLLLLAIFISAILSLKLYLFKMPPQLMPSFLSAVIKKRPLLDWFDCTCSFFLISVHSMIKLKLLNTMFKMKVMTKTYSESLTTVALQRRGSRVWLLSTEVCFLTVSFDCITVLTSDPLLSSDLQQGPSVAEMMVCLGPAEINHRFQKLVQLSETS